MAEGDFPTRRIDFASSCDKLCVLLMCDVMPKAVAARCSSEHPFHSQIDRENYMYGTLRIMQDEGDAAAREEPKAAECLFTGHSYKWLSAEYSND